MLVRAAVRFMAFLSLAWQVATKVTSSKVDQFPKILKSARGDNVSMFCTFPIFEDVPEVLWWRHNEESILEPDSRMRFHVQKGRGTFYVFNVTLPDAGMYHCKIKHQNTTLRAESGSLLNVCVPPILQKIIPVEGISGNNWTFKCETTAFYPEDLGISWLRDGVKIQAGIETVKNKIVGGLYEVTSSLEDEQPVRGSVVYTCLVSHTCLKVPTSVSYIFNRGVDPVREGITGPMIIGCVGALAMLLIMIIFMILKVKASAGNRSNSMEVGQNDEPLRQEPTKENIAYVPVNLIAKKGSAKHRHNEEHAVYSQIKKGSGDNKLTYAALQLVDSKKSSKPKRQDNCELYAEVKVTKKARS